MRSVDPCNKHPRHQMSSVRPRHSKEITYGPTSNKGHDAPVRAARRAASLAAATSSGQLAFRRKGLAFPTAASAPAHSCMFGKNPAQVNVLLWHQCHRSRYIRQPCTRCSILHVWLHMHQCNEAWRERTLVQKQDLGRPDNLKAQQHTMARRPSSSAPLAGTAEGPSSLRGPCT